MINRPGWDEDDEVREAVQRARKEFEARGFRFTSDIFPENSIRVVERKLRKLSFGEDYWIFDEDEGISLAFRDSMKPSKVKKITESIYRAMMKRDLRNNAHSFEEVSRELVVRTQIAWRMEMGEKIKSLESVRRKARLEELLKEPEMEGR